MRTLLLRVCKKTNCRSRRRSRSVSCAFQKKTDTINVKIHVVNARFKRMDHCAKVNEVVSSCLVETHKKGTSIWYGKVVVSHEHLLIHYLLSKFSDKFIIFLRFLFGFTYKFPKKVFLDLFLFHLISIIFCQLK